MRLAITWPVALMLPRVLTYMFIYMYARVGHRQEILSVSEYYCSTATAAWRE